MACETGAAGSIGIGPHIEHRRESADAVQKKRGMLVPNVFHRNGEPIHYFRRSWMAACVAAGFGKEVRDEK